jgi:hypothetical protein
MQKQAERLEPHPLVLRVRAVIVMVGFLTLLASGCCLNPTNSNSPPKPTATTVRPSEPHGVVEVKTTGGAQFSRPKIDDKVVKMVLPKSGAWEPVPDKCESGETYWKPGNHVLSVYCDVSKKWISKNFELKEGGRAFITIDAPSHTTRKKQYGWYNTTTSTTVTFPTTINIQTYDPPPPDALK